MADKPNRVLVTRAKGRTDALSAALVAGGARPIHVPLIAFEPTGAAWPRVQPGDVLAVTSATAVDYLDEAVTDCLIAAVGPTTRAALEARGLQVAICPHRGLAEALVAALGDLRGRRVLYPRAVVVPPEFERRLAEAGAEVLAIGVYRTTEPEVGSLPPAEVITLASGSAARHLARLDTTGRLAVIGPSTARVCRQLGLRVDAVATPHTSAGLASAALGLLPQHLG